MDIHVTDRSTFKQCRRQWAYECREHLHPIQENKGALWFGRGYHKAMSAYYTGQDPHEAFDQWFTNRIPQDVKAAMWPEELRDLETKQDLGHSMIAGYLDFAKAHDDFEVLHVETPLRVRIPGTYGYLIGTLDLLIRRNGRLYVMDHKTCESFVDPLHLELDDQMTAYLWLVWKVFGEMPAGAIYNEARKKIPAEPALVEKGKRLSKDKSIDTTVAKYLEAIHRYGFNPNDYADILVKIQDNQFYHREIIARNPHELEMFGVTLAQEYREMASKATPMYPNPCRECTWRCAYRILCKCQNEGGDLQSLKDSLFKVQVEREE